MSHTYLLAGASSEIAIETAKILTKQGNKVIALSTRSYNDNYDEFYQIEKYENDYFPKLDENLDGLIYFPGTINLKPFHRFNKQDFINDYEINALGAVLFVQQYLNNLKNSSVASIVFMSSVAAKKGMPFHASIAMAKCAIEGLTRSLAAELAPKIRVNAVAPSLTQTALADRFLNTPEKLEASKKRNPMKKIGTINEVSEAIHFLLSERSSWITGQVLSVDGGMSTLA
ncbi:MAG: SDR family oxidoreductase [Bacteroidota bacterium]|nr:SDR family oxidoreductase [Bacteroidota bacterium]